MIVPDVNTLVYAYNSRTRHHRTARTWLEEALNGTTDVGLPWVVAIGFVRLMTHPSVVEKPISSEAAVRIVEQWLSQPVVHALNPGPRHLEILRNLLQAAGAAANLTTDAHIAAICVEYQAELCSADSDMARFPGLRWTNPFR